MWKTDSINSSIIVSSFSFLSLTKEPVVMGIACQPIHPPFNWFDIHEIGLIASHLYHRLSLRVRRILQRGPWARGREESWQLTQQPQPIWRQQPNFSSLTCIKQLIKIHMIMLCVCAKKNYNCNCNLKLEQQDDILEDCSYSCQK